MNFRIVLIIIFLAFNSPVFSQFLQWDNTVTGLPALSNVQVATADVDHDQDMDIFLMGSDNNLENYTQLLINQGNGAFMNKGLVLPRLTDGKITVGDVNNDNYPDLLLSGQNASDISVTKLYLNNPLTELYVESTLQLAQVSYSAQEFFDFDADGDLDIFITGLDNGDPTSIISQLWRNDLKLGWTLLSNSLPQFYDGDAKSADFNRDNFPDLFLAGRGSGIQKVKDIFYGNGKGQFTQAMFDFPTLSNPVSDISDYNGDGYADIALMGSKPSQPYSGIFKNINGLAFQEISSGINQISRGSLKWCDADLDGDADLAITGSYTSTGIATYLYLNSENDNFLLDQSNLAGTIDGALTWMDYNMDKRPDLFVIGGTFSPSIIKFYKNTLTGINSRPVVPSNLKHTISTDSIYLRWNPSSDGSETPSASLKYNVWLSNQKDSFTVRSPEAALSNGTAYSYTKFWYTNTTTGWIKNIGQGKYYWRVQAIDHTQNTSLFSVVDSFMVCYAISIGADTNKCLNSSFTFSQGTSLDIVNWYTTQNGLVKTNSFNYNHTFTGTDTVVVKLQNPYGCTLYDSATVKAYALPASSLPGIIKSCFKTPYTVSQLANQDTLFWSVKNQMPSISFKGNSFTGINLKPDTLLIRFVSPKGCLSFDTVKVDTLSLPRFTLGSDTALCKGQQSIIYKVNRPDSINWYSYNTILGNNISQIAIPSVSDSIVIWARAKDLNGCIFYDTTFIRTRSLPMAFAGKDSIICFGVPHILGADTVAKGGSGIYSYAWLPSDNLNNTSNNKPETVTKTNKSYMLQVTDSKGCLARDTINIRVNPKPVLNAGTDHPICIGDSTVLGGIPTADSSLFSYHYTWEPGNLQSSNPKVAPKETTFYTLTVTTRNCPIDTASIRITVNTLPLPKTDPILDTVIGYGESVLIHAFGGISYEWEPKDNSLIDDPLSSSPVAKPLISQLYVVTVTDINGCKQKDSVFVQVKNEIFVPEIFSPNRDQINDEFLIEGVGVKEIDLRIFDRFGRVVYQSSDWVQIKLQGWNGAFKGNDLPTGTYIWALSGTFENGESIQYKGTTKGNLLLVK